jgi:hypothetical protein
VTANNIAQRSLSVGIHNPTVNRAIGLYPNPAVASVFVTPLPYQRVATVTTVLGQRCLSFALTSGSNTVDVSALAPGIYMLSLQSPSGVQTEGFVKQ